MSLSQLLTWDYALVYYWNNIPRMALFLILQFHHDESQNTAINIFWQLVISGVGKSVILKEIFSQLHAKVRCCL